MRLRATALALAVLLAAPAGAQTPSEVVAVAYRELPPGIAVQLRLLDDSELNLQVRDMIAGQLAASGYAVRDDAPFVLQVETQTASPGTGRDPSLGSFQATGEEAELRMNLWSNREESLLNSPDKERTAANLYRISLGLYDGRDGRYYWRGAASTVLAERDAAAASRDMVPALIAQLGKNAGGTGETAPAQ